MTSYNHDLWCTIDTNEVVTIVQKYNVQMNENDKFSWDTILIYLGTIEVTRDQKLQPSSHIKILSIIIPGCCEIHETSFYFKIMTN